jgi:hypothetical protein
MGIKREREKSISQFEKCNVSASWKKRNENKLIIQKLFFIKNVKI